MSVHEIRPGTQCQQVRVEDAARAVLRTWATTCVQYLEDAEATLLRGDVGAQAQALVYISWAKEQAGLIRTATEPV